MIESFEEVCASYDYCRWIGREGVKAAISRLKRVHEAEIAELQGQYERKAIDLQNAHDHELEQLRRLRFREGYEAGQRSMDAEHYAVALRLKHLPLDEDSHGNLSQIARAIWHGDFGWTKSACTVLRDELVRLLGGVHDEPAPTAASGCACDADCDCGHGDETAVESDRLRIEKLVRQRDELRKSLRKIAERAGVPHDVDLDEYSDDLVAKATLGKIDSTHEYIGSLEWQRDRQRKLLDEYERRDTAESIVRDIHVGKVTDSQAVERIRALR